MAKVRPLKKRTMTLDELQRRTLDVLDRTRDQFYRPGWQDGKSDDEFVRDVVQKLIIDIKQDRAILKAKAKRR